MHPNYRLVLYLSPLALAALVLAGLSFAEKSPEVQSVQQAVPPQEPIAAEMSKKETVASAFLRGLESQEYEVAPPPKPCPKRNTAIAPPASRPHQPEVKGTC
jgi:hypothetical protein